MLRRMWWRLCAANPVTEPTTVLLDSMRSHRSFRLDRIASAVGESDIIVAIQDSSKGFSFIGFPGLARDDVAHRLASVPLCAHHFHSVCGRERSACDFYADVDLDPSDDGEGILHKIVTTVEQMFEKVARGKEPLTVSILSGTTTEKQSYHVHIRSPTCAFEDFGVVRRVAENINDELGHDAIDLACYRENGMLRCAFSRKVIVSGSKQAVPMLPYEPADRTLSKLTESTKGLGVAEVLALSLITRQPQISPTLRIIKTTAKCVPRRPMEDERAGGFAEGATPAAREFLRESTKWVRYAHATRLLRSLPAGAAADFERWIRVGLALYSFNDNEKTFAEWVQFSSRAPEKFRLEDCEKKWQQFSRRPNAFTWRRGYNYLTKTVWRECGVVAPKVRRLKSE